MSDLFPDALPREQRLPTLLQAGVWLVFLFSPIFSLVSAPIPLWTKTLGFTSLTLFCVVYLLCYLVPRPLRRLPRWANTLGYTVVLAAIALSLAYAAGYSALAVLPFICATWVFLHRFRTSLIAFIVFSVILIGASVVWIPADERTIFAGALLTAMLMILGVRFALEKETQGRILSSRVALAEQREGWARDVHDLLGHSLTVVAVKTELASKLVERDPARAKAGLAEVLALTRDALAEVRSTVTDLRTPDLGTQILASRAACEAAGIRFSSPNSEVAEEIHEPIRGLFAWCLREAVTNVVRHAGARSCTVQVGPGELRVSDDGRGGVSPDGAMEGNGMRGMRERCEAVGATFQVGPGPQGRGTEVVVTV